MDKYGSRSLSTQKAQVADVGRTDCPFALCAEVQCSIWTALTALSELLALTGDSGQEAVQRVGIHVLNQHLFAYQTLLPCSDRPA